MGAILSEEGEAELLGVFFWEEGDILRVRRKEVKVKVGESEPFTERMRSVNGSDSPTLTFTSFRRTRRMSPSSQKKTPKSSASPSSERMAPMFISVWRIPKIQQYSTISRKSQMPIVGG